MVVRITITPTYHSLPLDNITPPTRCPPQPLRSPTFFGCWTGGGRASLTCRLDGRGGRRPPVALPRHPDSSTWAASSALTCLTVDSRSNTRAGLAACCCCSRRTLHKPNGPTPLRFACTHTHTYTRAARHKAASRPSSIVTCLPQANCLYIVEPSLTHSPSSSSSTSSLSLSRDTLYLCL